MDAGVVEVLDLRAPSLNASNFAKISRREGLCNFESESAGIYETIVLDHIFFTVQSDSSLEVMEPPPPPNSNTMAAIVEDAPQRDDEKPQVDSQHRTDSQTASEFINSQLQLEADAREALPYAFDSCTHSLGPLRQILFSCLTCNPPPESPSASYTPAGVCYSCSIACHGEHILVELFNKRNFVCDCGTTRLPATSPCTLRANPETGMKGVHSEKAAAENKYNENFRNRFCGCGEVYDAHTEKGTMFQCVGLGNMEDGGCGEDWWHPECIAGFKRDWHQHLKSETKDQNRGGEHREKSVEHQAQQSDELPLPPGFPDEEEFDAFICYKCVEAKPWIKRYAGTTGFLKPFFYKPAGTNFDPEKGDSDDKEPSQVQPPSTTDSLTSPLTNGSKKRKLEHDGDDDAMSSISKRMKETDEVPPPPSCKYEALPPASTEQLSLFCKEDFRDHICHCPTHFPLLKPFPQLLEEEETYEPPISESGDGNGDAASGARSHGTGSLLDRGEAALSNVDRVRAIEGVMVYNHLRDKVKAFLQPFAESGQAVGAEDIKKYFEKLRGDEEGIKAAAADKDVGGGGDNRREQSGY